MTSIRFFIANPKSDRSSVNAIVIHNKIRYKKAIGVSIDTKNWLSEKQKAIGGRRYPEGDNVNAAIDQWRATIGRMIARSGEMSLDISNQTDFWQLVECEATGKAYNINPSGEMTLVKYIESVFIPKFTETKSSMRIRRFGVVLSKLKGFEIAMNKKYTFNEINMQYYRDLQSYMFSLNHSVNYFGTMVKVIKQVMAEACDIDKLHLNHEFQSNSFKASSRDADTVYLTIEELGRIVDVKIDDDFINAFYPDSVTYGRENLKRSYNSVRNRFLIGAFTGLRMSDFNKLRLEDIADGKITVIAQKTKQRVVIPVHPVVQAIIDSGFDFTQNVSEQKTRQYIKRICQHVKIDQNVDVRENKGYSTEVKTLKKYEMVSSHTARRSFATNAFLAGIPPISIMKITGHTSEHTFMKYLRMTQEENANTLANHSFFK